MQNDLNMETWTLRSHLDKHKDLLDVSLCGSTDEERSRTVIGLLIEILYKEQKTISNGLISEPIVHSDDKDFPSSESTISSETPFFPNAASTCDFGGAETKLKEKVDSSSILNPGLPKVLKIDQNSDNYVPDTCLMEAVSDKRTQNDQEAFDLTIVPETQDDLPQTIPTSPVFSKSKLITTKIPEVERKVLNFDGICNDLTDSFGDPHQPLPEKPVEIKTEKKSEEQLKDEAIREKYPPLPVFTKNTARFPENINF